jgi:chemotaxis protein methyltransferase CheR
MNLDARPAVWVLPRLDERDFQLFQELIYDETGINLKHCKQQMLSSRLARRLRATGVETFGDYYRWLKDDDPGGVELAQMINAVTTNKTAFFREGSHFEFLKTWIGERALEGQRRFRFWCAAASTGEEPYTIAMTIEEALGLQMPRMDVRILATDINTEVLTTAELGLYRATHLTDVSLPRQSRFFLRGKGSQAGSYLVKPRLRQLISFQQLNLMAPDWPVRGPFDAVFCRNILIYFDDPTQRKLIGRLSGLLSPQGLLFVGHSEALQRVHELQTVGPAVYRRRGEPSVAL